MPKKAVQQDQPERAPTFLDKTRRAVITLVRTSLDDSARFVNGTEPQRLVSTVIAAEGEAE